MASVARMTHRGRGGRHHARRMRVMGYHRCYSGENVAEGRLSAEDAFAGWVKSAPHRRNLVRRFRDMGAGVVRGSNGRVYWTQVFGTRK